MADRSRSKSPSLQPHLSGSGRANTKSAKSTHSSASAKSNARQRSPLSGAAKSASSKRSSSRGKRSSQSRGSPGARSRSPSKGQGRAASRSPGGKGLSRRGTGGLGGGGGTGRSARLEKSMQEASKGGSSATGKRMMANLGAITSKELSILDMAGQGLTFVAASTFSKKDVGILDLSSNNIRAIPHDIGKLTTLVHIDLSKNGIRCLHAGDYAGLPVELASLPHLEIIIISECNLPYIPPAIFKCKQLKTLDISRNKINILLPEIGNLEQLRHLNAQSTSISTLPPEIAFCQELEELLLSGNVIESLPETMREMPKLKQLAINYRSFFTILDDYMDNLLKKGQIQSEHIPLVVFEMPGLDSLDLEGTKINFLPERCLGRLRQLYLQGNYFRKVPSLVINLPSLVNLDLSANMLDTLPGEIARLTNLTVLKANDNQLRNVTASVGQLRELEQLALGGNQLQEVPDTLGQLSKLKSLVLDRNQLTALPDSLVNLTELHTLDLTDNRITALPANFYRMQKLCKSHTYQNFHKYGLWLHKNPLSTPPEHVWKSQDPQPVYEYMKKLRIKKTENLVRQKLVLLGVQGSGKTSLLRTLSSGKSSLTGGPEHSTPLVDLRCVTTDNHVTLLVYDLGGAPVYANTHHLFLDEKALYVIVYDHRSYTPAKHAQAIGDWLDLLYLHAPGAVVKLVGTQCDLAYPEMNATVLQQVRDCLSEQLKGYTARIKDELSRINAAIENKDGRLSKPEVDLMRKQKMRLVRLGRNPLRIHHDVAMVSCAEGAPGVSDLVQGIEIMAVNKELFPHAQRQVPEQWHRFRKHLHTCKQYCLTLQQVRDMAAEGFTDLDLASCLHFMHDIGDVIWFSSHPRLQGIVFHRPRTLVSTLQGLFNHNMSDFLDYKTNKVFMAKGGMDEKQFEIAKEHFLNSGQISRAILKAFWFYQNVSYDHFIYLCDLIPKLDLCFAIPQSEIPLHRYDFEPLMVVPAFVRDSPPPDISNLWPAEPPGPELAVHLTFPLLYPAGLLEKLSCRLQRLALRRHDWSDVIRVELERSLLLVSRYLHPTSYDFMLSVAVRGEAVGALREDLAEVFTELHGLMLKHDGLVWYTRLEARNCGGGGGGGGGGGVEFFPACVWRTKWTRGDEQ